MTNGERLKYYKAINLIDRKLLSKPGFVMEPDWNQIEAITLAVKSMEERMQATGNPLGKHIAVLQYHIKRPTALLFKDRNTMDALTAGILAMKWMMKDDMYEGGL